MGRDAGGDGLSRRADAAGLNAYLLDIQQCGRLADPRHFWRILRDEARLVDSFPGCDRELIDALTDFFDSERRIGLPRRDLKDLGIRIVAQPPARVVYYLSGHDAGVLGSRIAKWGLGTHRSAESIRSCYGIGASAEVIRATIEFLARLRERVTADHQRLLVLLEEPALPELQARSILSG